MKLFLSLVFVLCSLALTAQNDSIQPPYKRFPAVPPFKLMLADSSYFSKSDIKKNTPLFLFMFSPECEHCKQETIELVKNIDLFKKVQIVMATTYPLPEMKQFIDYYQLQQFSNIRVGRDVNFLLPPFFAMKHFPFLALYKKDGNLIGGFEGSLPLNKVAEKFSE